VDVVALVADFQGLAVVALALADVAGDEYIREEVHLHPGDAIALAGLATPALDVKAKAPGAVAARAGLGCAGQQFPDAGKQPRIGGRVRAWGPSDGALVDGHHLIELRHAFDAIVGRALVMGAIKRPRGLAMQGVVNERGLAGPRNPRDGDHQPGREVEVDAPEVVAAGAADHQFLVGVALRPLRRYGDAPPSRQVVPRQRTRGGLDLGRRALGNDMAAVGACARPHVEDVVRRANGLLVVLDHDDRVTQIAQVVQRPKQAGVVALMQADGGLIEDVHHAHQAGADLAGQPDALGLTAG